MPLRRCRTTSWPQSPTHPFPTRRHSGVRGTSSKPVGVSANRETLERFKEVAAEDPRTVIRELKAVGGDLRALRLALTGRDRGPELAAILAALPKEEALRRVDQALQHAQP